MMLGPHRFSMTRRRNRAMALMAAIMMFVLIGAAVTAMMMTFATEARRTRDAVAGPQLRQLLLAGATLARVELHQHGPDARDVSLPCPLPGATTTLHITPDPHGAAVRIAAAYHDARASQLLRLTRGQDNTWTIVSAALH